MTSENYKHLFIIGAAKSGTTFLYDQLINHPKLVGADGHNKKEEKLVNLKEPKLLLKNDITKEKFLSAFEVNLRAKTTANILVDATTDYTKWPYKFISDEDIKRITNDFLCIYVVRDPIDRFESHINFKYSHRKYMLKYGLDDILDVNGSWIALNIGNYAMQLNEYKDIYDSGKLLIIDFNELTNNTSKCLEKICKKINIDINELPFNDFELNSNKTKDIVSELPFGLNLQNFPLANLIRDKLTKKITKELRKFYNNLYKQKQLPKRILTESEKIKLAKIYKPSLIKLKKDFGINYYETSWTTIRNYL